MRRVDFLWTQSISSTSITNVGSLSECLQTKTISKFRNKKVFFHIKQIKENFQTGTYRIWNIWTSRKYWLSPKVSGSITQIKIVLKKMGEFSSQYWTPGSISFSKYFKSPTNVNIVKKTLSVKNQSYTTKYTLYLPTERLIVSSVLRLSVQVWAVSRSAPSETNWKLLHGRVLISLGIYLCSDKILYREKLFLK